MHAHPVGVWGSGEARRQSDPRRGLSHTSPAELTARPGRPLHRVSLGSGRLCADAGQRGVGAREEVGATLSLRSQGTGASWVTPTGQRKPCPLPKGRPEAWGHVPLLALVLRRFLAKPSI